MTKAFKLLRDLKKEIDQDIWHLTDEIDRKKTYRDRVEALLLEQCSHIWTTDHVDISPGDGESQRIIYCPRCDLTKKD